MPSSYARLVNQITILALSWSVLGSPQLAFPLYSQLPPVAYVGKPYDFAFSPTISAQIATSSGLNETIVTADVPSGNLCLPDTRKMLARPILAAVIPATALLALVVVGVFCLRRKGNKRTLFVPTICDKSQASFHADSIDNLSSRPELFTSTGLQSSNQNSIRPAPRLQLSWASCSSRHIRSRVSQTRSSNKDNSLGISWDDLLKTLKPEHRHDALSVETPITEVYDANPKSFPSTKIRTHEFTTVMPLQPFPKRGSEQLKENKALQANSNPQSVSFHWPKRMNGAGNGSDQEANHTIIRQSIWADDNADPIRACRKSTNLLELPHSRPPRVKSIVGTAAGPSKHDSILQTPTPVYNDHRCSILSSFETTKRRQHIQKARDKLDGRETDSIKSSAHVLGRRAGVGFGHSQLWPRQGIGNSTVVPQAFWDDTRPGIESSRTDAGAAVAAPFSLRAVSPMSSRQFESAVSSDSELEDDVSFKDKVCPWVDFQQDGALSRAGLQTFSGHHSVGGEAPKSFLKTPIDKERHTSQGKIPMKLRDCGVGGITTWKNSSESHNESSRFV